MGKFLKQYEILYKKANSDLNLARYAFNGYANDEIDVDLDIIAFHLQQAAEKFLKSVLDYNNIKFPKSHDIEILVDLVKEYNIPLDIDRDSLINLNDYAVEGRYTVIHDDLDDFEHYIRLIEEMKIEIDNNLKCSD